MGIEGLWKLIEGSAIRRPLSEFVEDEGIKAHKYPCGVRLGVDASIWLYQTQQPFRFGHAQSGENPELRTLFHRLARYASMAINLVIVFDGPGRPSCKRSTRVITDRAHFLTNGLRSLAEAFGFVTYVAPGEAEAELAHLNKLGIIDAVLTDDSDALIFGAKVIIRNPNIKKDGDYITIYSQSSLTGNNSNTPKLTPQGLLLFAVLRGGDYSNGLPGCGSTVALRLTRYDDLANTLYSATTSGATNEDLKTILLSWSRRLSDCLRYDPEGHLGRRYPTLAGSVPLTFPDPAILHAYTHPVVSAAPPYATLGFDTRPPRVDVQKLTQLCEVYFGFGTPHGIVTTFEKNTWQAILLRDIICTIVSGRDPRMMQSVLAEYSIVDSERHKPRPPYARALIQFRPRKYINYILSSLRTLPNRVNNRNLVNADVVYRIRLPFSIISHLDHRLPSVLPNNTILPRPPSVASSIEVEDVLTNGAESQVPPETLLPSAPIPSCSSSLSPPPRVIPAKRRASPAANSSSSYVIDLTLEEAENMEEAGGSSTCPIDLTGSP